MLQCNAAPSVGSLLCHNFTILRHAPEGESMAIPVETLPLYDASATGLWSEAGAPASHHRDATLHHASERKSVPSGHSSSALAMWSSCRLLRLILYGCLRLGARNMQNAPPFAQAVCRWAVNGSMSMGSRCNQKAGPRATKGHNENCR